MPRRLVFVLLFLLSGITTSWGDGAPQPQPTKQQTLQALQLREATLPPDSLELADTLQQLGELIDTPPTGAVRAEQLFLRALKIRQAALPPTAAELGRTLASLAVVYDLQGKYPLAQHYGEQALDIQEKARGKDDLAVARSLMNLATIHQDQGQFREAETLFLRALDIRQRKLPVHDSAIGTVLGGLARLYKAQGDYVRASKLYGQALEIQEAARGPNSPEVAGLVNNIGVLYRVQGDFREAERYYLRALQIRESLDDQPKSAETLHNLAWIYFKQGSYALAKESYERALKIKEARGLANDPDVASTLLSLAVLLTEMKDYDLAARRFESARNILAVTAGRDHPDYATALHNNAQLFMQRGLYDRAEPLYQEALKIREGRLSKNHPEVAETLSNLGDLLLQRGDARRGDLAAAESYFARAREMYRSTMGDSYPSLVSTLAGQATLRIRAGYLTQGIDRFKEALAISERNLRNERLAFSESRLTAYLQRARTLEEAIYSLLLRNDDKIDSEVARLALSLALLRKGRVVDELADLSRTLHAAEKLDPAARADFDRLRVTQSQLALLAQDSRPSLVERQQREAELKTQREQLEQKLATRLAAIRERHLDAPPEELIARVAAALPRDGALIELVTATASPWGGGKIEPPARGPQTRGPHYVALVLRQDGTVRAVKLGPVPEIDGQVALLLQGLQKGPLESPPPARGPDLSLAGPPDYHGPAQQLYSSIVAPLKLAGTVHLLLSPEGQLNLVPFAVLQEGGRFLIDRYQLSYLTTGRDLLRGADELAPAATAVLFGNPDFGQAPPRAPSPAYRQLPGTGEELAAILPLLPASWRTELFQGAAASKSALLGLRAPGLLHIATHGAFETLSLDAGPQKERGAGPPMHRIPVDPLLQSRLLLAGVNRTQATGSAADSVATALELASLDLWGTQLVVLSACQTAQGTPERGQGVYGLRRAFLVAGAQTVVASLWGVDDKVTRELMVDYYARLLAGAGRAEALQSAMTRVRTNHPHPHYWAPFIVLGQAAPLRGIDPQPPAVSHR